MSISDEGHMLRLKAIIFLHLGIGNYEYYIDPDRGESTITPNEFHSAIVRLKTDQETLDYYADVLLHDLPFDLDRVPSTHDEKILIEKYWSGEDFLLDSVLRDLFEVEKHNGKMCFTNGHWISQLYLMNDDFVRNQVVRILKDKKREERYFSGTFLNDENIKKVVFWTFYEGLSTARQALRKESRDDLVWALNGMIRAHPDIVYGGNGNLSNLALYMHENLRFRALMNPSENKETEYGVQTICTSPLKVVQVLDEVCQSRYEFSSLFAGAQQSRIECNRKYMVVD